MCESEMRKCPVWAHQWIRTVVAMLMAAGLGWNILDGLGEQASVYSGYLIMFGAAYGVILFSYFIFKGW